jgi:hypothetical protein
MYESVKAMCKLQTGVDLGKFPVVPELCFAGSAISLDGCLSRTP